MPFDGFEESPLNFKAYEMPAYAKGKNGMYLVPDVKHIARQDPKNANEPLVLGTVGKDYKMIQNADLFRTIDDALTHNCTSAELAGIKIRDRISYGGAWCMREYVFLNIKTAIDAGYATHYKGSDVGFRIVASHAFDGSSSVKMLSGAIDFYCTNGVVTGEFDQFVQRHTSGLALPKIGNRLRANIDIFWKQAEVFRAWAKKELTDEVVKQLIAALPGMSDRRAALLFGRWQYEAADRGPTVWALHSALTFFASHNSEAFPIRNTGDDHEAVTLNKRALQVKNWIDHPSFQHVAETGYMKEAA